MSYAEGKAKIIEEAMNYQNSFSEGKSYSWSEIAEFSNYFSKMAKRYGLIKEFRENGIL